MTPKPTDTTGTFGENHHMVAATRDGVLPWLTDPKIVLAFCTVHDITIRNWMLVGLQGQQSWCCELEVAFGPDKFLAEIEVEPIADGRYRACMVATGEPLRMEIEDTLHSAMLTAEQMAAAALCKTCNAIAVSDPPT